MIPETAFNGFIVRVFISVVGSVSPLSLLYVCYSLAYLNGLESTLRDLIFLVCLSESLFWGWYYIKQFRAPVYVRKVPSASMRAKLKKDTLETIGSKEEAWRYFLSGWFTKGDKAVCLEDICRDNVAEWFAWAFFAASLQDVIATEAWKEELDETVADMCDQVQKYCPGLVIPNGRNPNVECIKLTLDPIRSEHRPLAFYAVRRHGLPLTQVVYLLQSGASLTFRHHGYTYYPGRLSNRPVLGYWHRRPTVPSFHPPLVIIHGIGSVITLTKLISVVAMMAPTRDIFVLEMRHISMRLPRPNSFDSPQEIATQVCDIIDRHAHTRGTKAVFLSHSLGSIYTVWMLQFAPERVAKLVLCDPISMLLQYSDVAYNFVYRTTRTPSLTFFRWIAREPGVALTLARHFHWFENVFPILSYDAKPLALRYFLPHVSASIYVSERDCIVPSARIAEFLGEGRQENMNVVVMKGLDHGAFILDDYWLHRIADDFVAV